MNLCIPRKMTKYSVIFCPLFIKFHFGKISPPISFYYVRFLEGSDLKKAHLVYGFRKISPTFPCHSDLPTVRHTKLCGLSFRSLQIICYLNLYCILIMIVVQSTLHIISNYKLVTNVLILIYS